MRALLVIWLHMDVMTTQSSFPALSEIVLFALETILLPVIRRADGPARRFQSAPKAYRDRNNPV